jgi:hypothetical protein
MGHGPFLVLEFTLDGVVGVGLGGGLLLSRPFGTEALEGSFLDLLANASQIGREGPFLRSNPLMGLSLV